MSTLLLTELQLTRFILSHLAPATPHRRITVSAPYKSRVFRTLLTLTSHMLCQFICCYSDMHWQNELVRESMSVRRYTNILGKIDYAIVCGLKPKQNFRALPSRPTWPRRVTKLKTQSFKVLMRSTKPKPLAFGAILISTHQPASWTQTRMTPNIILLLL